MKTCPDCGLEKAAGDFWRRTASPDGLFTYCKPCARARNNGWHAANRERVSARNVPARHRYLSGLPIEEKVLASARWRAKREGVEFRLTAADISVPSKCPALGMPLHSHMGEGGTPGARRHSPTLARISEALGYVPGNVMVVSSRASRTGAYRRLPYGDQGGAGQGSGNPGLE